MNREERRKDWFVRYHLFFGKRYTRKQKDRFLTGLSTDIMQFRKDLKIDTFKINKHEYRNLYVGDLKKADTVLCTYYDTPAARFSPYRFFDVDHRMKSTTTFILVTSILFIAFGLFFTLFVAIPVFQSKRILSLPFISNVIFYFLYFYFLNKIARGWPRRKNLIQNTSSVLALLDCIAEKPSSRLAFAFVDAGCTNDAGLKHLMEQTKAKILMLDSIGSEKPLYFVEPEQGRWQLIDSPGGADFSFFKKNRLVYLISGEEEQNRFVLSREQLKKKELNERNMNTAFGLLSRMLKGDLK